MPMLGFLIVGGKKYTLKYGETYVIGFMSDDHAHDIAINDASVDIRHCVLDFTEPIPKIFDIKSKRGTFVDHEQIPACCMFPLRKSATIQIGCVDAILQLLGEGDSDFLEDRLSPPGKDNGSEKGVPIHQPETAKSHVTNSEHQFLVPTVTARTFSKSIGHSTTDESFDSFSIPETQVPVKDALPQVDDDEDSFYIPETQDAALCNYPRVAFENEDVNEAVADCDKIPSSQFRICTQDFNGSDDELSNHSDDILANVPCSLVIPTIRHSPVQIIDTSRRQENSEIEKELSSLRWSTTSHQTSHNATTPDDLVVPNQAQIEVPKTSSQCSTPDIFADQEPLLDDLEKSLKENEPPPVAVGYNKQPQVSHRPSAQKASLTPNCKSSFDEQSVEKSPLPPTQLFVLPPPKTKPPPAIVDKKKPADMNDDDLPPTQVFQPVPAKSKTKSNNIFLSSTLVDSGMQLSESSFKAKCNKLLDSDDDEMDEVVAPELVQKYRKSLENAKDPQETPPSKGADERLTSPQETVSNDSEKMLPPKNVPIQTPKDKAVASAQKPKLNNCDAKYVNIEEFLCTPDFLGKEFAKDENLQKKAELNWKNQRKALFQNEETPTKPEKNESDDSQDSFIDLIPHKKKQEVNVNVEQPEGKAQKELGPENRRKSKEPPAEGRTTRRVQSCLIHGDANKNVLLKTVSDSKMGEMKKQSRTKRSAAKSNRKPESIGDKNDEPPKEKKSKDSLGEGKSRPKHTESNTSEKSANKTEDIADPMLAEEKVVKQIAKRRTRPSVKDLQISNKDDDKQLHNLSRGSSKSSTSYEGKMCIDQKWTEKRILEVVLNKNGAKTKKINSTKSSIKIDSNALSRTRSKSKSSEVIHSTHVNNSSVESAAASRKVSDKKRSNASRDEKKLRAAEEDKSKFKKIAEQKDAVNEKAERVKKNITLNKIVEVKKPQKRLTRLRSAKPIEASPILDQPPEPTQVQSSRQTRGSVRTLKDTEEDEPKHDTIDLTEIDNEDRSNSETISSGVKRKNNEEGVESKRSRPASSESHQLNNLTPKPKLKITMTMCDPRYQEVLEKHSGNLWLYTKDPKECDVLILEKGNRTYKLMVAIARGIPIIKLDWLMEVIKRKSIAVPMEEYIFQDRQFQERHQFLMKKSLFLAKTTSLFKGISFLMTPNIRPSPAEMKDIITCAGGMVPDQIPKLKQRIYLVSQANDNQYWHQYRRSNSNIKIVTTEGVMASVMQQSEAPLIKSIIQ